MSEEQPFFDIELISPNYFYGFYPFRLTKLTTLIRVNNSRFSK